MKINDVDWSNWTPEQTATLMFVIDDNRVLLIRKKRGLGAGKINGPGGRLEEGETPYACAIRETQEEVCITPGSVEAHGELRFHAEDMPTIHVYVFVAHGFEGTPAETDEAIPLWFDFNQIPYDEMWDDDLLWLPAVLAGQSVQGWFSFRDETLLDYRLDLP